MPQEAEEAGSGQIAISLRSLLFSLLLCPVQKHPRLYVDSILNGTGQNNKGNKRGCQEIATWLLPFCSSNSNIYFFHITISLSTLLSAGWLAIASSSVV